MPILPQNRSEITDESHKIINIHESPAPEDPIQTKNESCRCH